MKITRDEVETVASLARLEFAPDELDTFTSQLSELLEYVDKLSELDLEGVEPTAHVHDIVNAFRDDVRQPSFDNARALANAPASEGGCYRVAKVIEEA